MTTSAIMTPKHILLTLLVILIWGLNFIFLKLSLNECPPLLLCALRFLFASIPAIFFLKLPSASFKWVVLYGLVMFALQFAFLFMGIHAGMPPGMASLIMQVQVFFSMIFSVLVLSEKPSRWQVLGSLVSFIGIALIIIHLDQNMTPLGFIFILLASASWGAGNLIAKKLQKINMISLVAWGCFIACIPLFILSLVFEGPTAILSSYYRITWVGSSALFYTVYMSTWIGYGVWNNLLRLYPIGVMVPFTLLIPVVGIIGSILILGEPFASWKLISILFVLGGVYIHLQHSRSLKTKQDCSSS